MTVKKTAPANPGRTMLTREERKMPCPPGFRLLTENKLPAGAWYVERAGGEWLSAISHYDSHRAYTNFSTNPSSSHYFGNYAMYAPGPIDYTHVDEGGVV